MCRMTSAQLSAFAHRTLKPLTKSTDAKVSPSLRNVCVDPRLRGDSKAAGMGCPCAVRSH